ADRPLADSNAPGYALAPRRLHDSAGPLDQRTGARAAVTPLLTDGTEVIGKGIGRAAALLARDQDDVRAGQVQARVRGLDPGVVPPLEFAQEHIDIDVPFELEVTAQAVEVVRQDDQAGRGWHQLYAALDTGDLLVTHRRVTGAEIDHARGKALDPLAAADGVVAQLHLGLALLIFFPPLLVERRREGRPRAAQLDRARGDVAPVTVSTTGGTDAAGHHGREQHDELTSSHERVSSPCLN